MGDVIDIFSRKIVKEKENTIKTASTEDAKTTFEKQASRNKANQERLRKERDQANKNVMKSYRIK
ncbi:hypothetical protein GCL60_04625 [Silvanigrella paludirubra]|jgi:hypothetical protein|uniref:Uncharacterized protein n=1 Tax=Silvanigrella paludirubra TaxID=2499159 RepID=A0A6N6VT83_9BACT|nr:hypothetical protein [Silvanigrella paludirubra]KAB8039545.1 hypothetical protein GCL60_04625 [Silvanigrella paludirubra]